MNNETPNYKKHFRTVFFGEVVQLTSLTVSGSLEDNNTDSPLSRDGQNRLTLRGTSLAGALIETARKLGYKIEDYISGGEKESRWIIYNSHPTDEKNIKVEKRQMVGLLHQTRASAEEKHALFDIETTPRGVRWPFMVEINVLDDNEGKSAEALFAKVASEWQNNFGILGGNAARGCGFVKIEKLTIARLYAPDVFGKWPNSNCDNLAEKLNEHIKNKDTGFEKIELDKLLAENRPLKMDNGHIKHQLKITAQINVGENNDGYGVDMLSVGGHFSNLDRFNEDVKNKFLKAEGMKSVSDDTDFMFVYSKYPIDLKNPGDVKSRPFIPGSSIRGALRHTISEMLRKQKHQIRDPNSKTKNLKSSIDTLDKLFGFVDEAKNSTTGKFDVSDGALVVFDSYLADDNYTMALIEHHAEDEFTAGVYGSGKFNRVAMVNGRMKVEMIIEAKDDATLKKYCNLLAPALNLANNGHFDLGGGAYRGFGWPTWQKFNITTRSECKNTEVGGLDALKAWRCSREGI